MTDQSDSEHTLTLKVFGAKDWNEVEDQAAQLIRRYYCIPARGRNAEPRHALLDRAKVTIVPNADDTFDAYVEVTK